jgi:long-chain fatty acid transport protein
MRKLFYVVSLFVVCLMMVPSHALAAGFALPEQSASAMGMGSAFVGQADDASAAWYNPAGMTQLNGTQVMGGFVVIYPDFSHESSNGATTDTSKRTFHTPILFYATHKLNDRISFGVGVNNPFGMSTNWQPTSATREVAVLSKMKTTEANPSVAVKINDHLSLAAGLAYVQLRATLTSVVPGTSFISSLDGSGYGWGGNAAALVKFSDAVSTGLSYRSRVRVDVNGMVQVPGAVPLSSARTTITLPDLLSWGVSVKPTDKLTLNMDLGYTWWSTYDKLEVADSNNPLYNKTYDKQWNDVWNIRIGGQYKLNEQWKLRAGYQYDKNPVPDHYFETRVPDSDRHGVSIGAGYTIGNVTVDAAYLYIRFNTRHINDSVQDNATTNANSLNGTYNADAHVLGVSMAYKF